jgi:N-acetylneuraminate synthase
MLDVFRQRYGCYVGLSDHSSTIYPGLAAATLGVEVIEVHVTLSREMAGPDVVASLTTSELAQLVSGVRFIERMRTYPVDKDAIASEMEPLRAIFTKSIVARVTLEPGTLVTADNVAFKKPGTGMPVSSLPEILGRRVRRRVPADSLISQDDLDGVEST